MPFVHQHQVVVAEIPHGDTLDALLLRQFVQVDDFHVRKQVGPGLGGKQPCGQAACPQFLLMLHRHLFVGRQQNDVIEAPAGGSQILPVLQDMGVHEEGLAGAGRALKRDGPQVVGRVFRHVPRQPVCGPRPIQVGAKRLGIVEIPVQVTFGEQQREVLIRLPDAALFRGHTQLVTVRNDVGVVLSQFLGPDRCSRRQIQCAGVFTLPSGIEAGRNVAHPVQHRAHVIVSELPANKTMQD